MNNQEFIKALSKRTGGTFKETEAKLQTVVKTMTDNFSNGESVMITNFGLFEVRQKEQRTIINPETKKRMVVPQKQTLVFKPVETLKQKFYSIKK
ncbi:MAG: HU family DNA-binding protein [Prevotellaceae bacterium]|nr:HU family DNA-binding protein [Prevotellaceae bacterium]